MDHNEIQLLLDKYFAGETSLIEEKLLKEYFTQPDIHVDFETWKPLFDYFSAGKDLMTSMEFDERFLRKIRKGKVPLRRSSRYWLRAAAIVLLLIGAAGIIYRSSYKHNSARLQTMIQVQTTNNSAVEITDTYDNPEEAKKAVEQALALLSSHLDKGKNTAEKNIEKIDVLNKALDN